MAVISLEAGARTAIILPEEKHRRVTSGNLQDKRGFQLGTCGGFTVFVALFLFFAHDLGLSDNTRYFVCSFSFFAATLTLFKSKS